MTTFFQLSSLIPLVPSAHRQTDQTNIATQQSVSAGGRSLKTDVRYGVLKNVSYTP